MNNTIILNLYYLGFLWRAGKKSFNTNYTGYCCYVYKLIFFHNMEYLPILSFVCHI